METLSVADALSLLTQPKATRGPGKGSKGGLLVKEFLDSGAVFARHSESSEKDRKATMMSVKKFLRDTDQEDLVWVQADQHSLVFTNMKLAADLEGDSGKAITAAYQAFKRRYANVGRKVAPLDDPSLLVEDQAEIAARKKVATK